VLFRVAEIYTCLEIRKVPEIISTFDTLDIFMPHPSSTFMRYLVRTEFALLMWLSILRSFTIRSRLCSKKNDEHRMPMIIGFCIELISALHYRSNHFKYILLTIKKKDAIDFTKGLKNACCNNFGLFYNTIQRIFTPCFVH